MPLYCDVDQCQNLAARIHGDCVFCQRHLCIDHLQKPGHKCPLREDDAYDAAILKAQALEIQILLSRINLTALASCASRLHDRRPCTVIKPTDLSRAMGNVNFHLELHFDDGVQWIARIKRQNVTTPPELIQKLVIESEVATYHFLKSTKVPVPTIFGFCPSSDNAVGVPYILMDKISGQPFSTCDPDHHQKLKVMNQLATIYNELYRHPFHVMGSPQPDISRPSKYSIGPLASELLSNVTGRGISVLGPFDSLKEYYQQTISRILDMVADGEFHAAWAIDVYLVHLGLLDFVRAQPSPSSPGEKFYLRHFDDQGSHIMVDDDYTITAIIDWEWAYTAPAEIAFASPMMLWNVGGFFDGDDNLSREELEFARMLDAGEASSLGEIVRDGKKLQRLNFVLGNEIFDQDISSYLENFARLDLGQEASSGWEDWKTQALEHYKSDEGLQRLRRVRSDM